MGCSRSSLTCCSVVPGRDDQQRGEGVDGLGACLQVLAGDRAVLNGVRAERQQAAIQHEQAAAHAAHGDAATARLEGGLATRHRQRLADVEAALDALDAAVLDLDW
jgi:hypothetical protein